MKKLEKQLNKAFKELTKNDDVFNRIERCNICGSFTPNLENHEKYSHK